MKFTTNKSKFEIIISSMQPFLEKKDSSAITSHIYIEIVNNLLFIKSTDYEMGLSANIEDITNMKNGKSTVNGGNLLNIIRRLKNENINFEVKNNYLEIKQNKSSFKLPMYNADEYPDFPSFDNFSSLNINTFSLINSIKKITPAIDNNNPKFALNGALIDIKNENINFVSTDTRRLAICNLRNISNNPMQIIVPKKAIIEIQKLFFDETNISYDETTLILSNNNFTFYTKLINSEFPDYERIIPKSLKHSFQITKNILIESIKLITSLKPNIKITFSPSNILFESVDEDSEAKTQIDLNINIDNNFYIAVNSKYLLDFLATSESENITIGFNESNLPFYLEDKNFKTIIMPIILDK
jgi:DNA polymerase-3 subunit beta